MLNKKKKIFLLFFGLTMWVIGLITVLSVIKKYVSQLPETSALEEIKPSLITKIYDINEEVIAEIFAERRILVPLGKIPVDLQNAVIATEDTRFFKHWGISLRDTLRAFLTNLFHRRVIQGGSSITQQLARVLFLNKEKTLPRKIKEALLSLKIENRYTKEEILEMYLNHIYFGHGTYGIESASQNYFNKCTEELNLAECALLAGLIRSPENYSPFNNPEAAKRRFKWVLYRMRKIGYITPQEEKEAFLSAYKVKKSGSIINKNAPYFVDPLRQYLENTYGTNTTYRGGLKVYTTLDLQMQRIAEQTLEDHLRRFDEVHMSTAPIQGSLVSLEVKTGKIKALIGGRDFKISQFNRVTQAQRQPGSAFKPFLYAAALDNNFNAASIIDDSPIIFYNTGRDWEILKNVPELFKLNLSTTGENSNKIWIPENYDQKFLGPTTIRIALEQSRNVCAVKLISEIGPRTVSSYAHKLGIESPLGTNLSLALGSSEVNLLELTQAYGTFANQGIKVSPYSIIKIEDALGNILEVNRAKEEEVLSPQTAYLITDLLQGVIKNGTGYNARALGRPSAGKTGTTNEFNDAWFIGYTPELVTGVWVGYDDRSTLGERESGGVVACPIWTQFMQETLKNKPVSDFPVPENIVFIKIDPKTGLLARENSKEALLEAFREGTEPIEYSVP